LSTYTTPVIVPRTTSGTHRIERSPWIMTLAWPLKSGSVWALVAMTASPVWATWLTIDRLTMNSPSSMVSRSRLRATRKAISPVAGSRRTI